ncbi:MAG: PH domain-containing protein [Duncaniella sp.]|nr:PH domain-containing protein [Duncaniella sp.]
MIIRHNSCEDNIPYKEIESVRLATPAPDARCTFGIPGCSGYWGTWHDSEHGTYTACYGRRDQCFFVRLKDGRGYMLGCKDPSSIVDRLNDILK